MNKTRKSYAMVVGLFLEAWMLIISCFIDVSMQVHLVTLVLSVLLVGAGMVALMQESKEINHQSH